MAEEFKTGQSGPAQQVEAEVAAAQVSHAITDMFGGDYNHHSGGGGAGGHYEFTSLAELDSIITELKTVRDGIAKDGRKLGQAEGLALPPADDIMSTLQAKATVVSIQAAIDHNQRMQAAADAEIAKLEAARRAYSHVESTNAQSFGKGG